MDPQSPSARKKIRLGDLLVEHGMINDAQLRKALASQKQSGKKIGHILIENGYTSEGEILTLLSKQLGMPLVDLTHFQFNPSVVKLLPETYARRYRAIALEKGAKGILVGFCDPTDIFGFDQLVRLLNQPVLPAIVRESELLAAINRIYKGPGELNKSAGVLEQDVAREQAKVVDEIPQADAEAPVARLIQTIFEDAIHNRASDIHIEPEKNIIRIRQRIDGRLKEEIIKQKNIASALTSKLKIMAGLDISEKRLPQDGRFNYTSLKHTLDVRMSSMPSQYGEVIVLRLLDRTEGVPSLSQIGMKQTLQHRFKNIITRPNGLILVTGPTGSGKTTTLYAALQHINTPELKIITVEDPVEYQLERVNQIQVNSRIDLTFARVLRAALRQDPDAILVGEIRDGETAEIALRAALTGHLVFSTLHTNDAISTAIRLVDMGVEPYLVAAAVNVIVAQRLVRTNCEQCALPTPLDDHQTAWLKATYGEQSIQHSFYKGAGCDQCNRSGYFKRKPVFELLELTPELSDLLRDARFQAFSECAKQHAKYVSIAQAGFELAQEGCVSIEELIRLVGWMD
jgi:MSHA biogenesis protein MshE